MPAAEHNKVADAAIASNKDFCFMVWKYIAVEFLMKLFE